MNLVELIISAIYGVVEGITEWLPISSTGHMLLLNEFLPLPVSADFWDMFLVVIQLGAILAVVVLFFYQLNPFSPSKGKAGRRRTWRMWGQIIVACLPAAIIGVPFNDWMTDHLSSPFVIAAALIVYGVLFIIIENARESKVKRILEGGGARPQHMAAPEVEDTNNLSELADSEAAVQRVQDMPWKTAFGIGCFQVLSLVPGTSRSGSTIIGGLLLNCSRSVAAEFTFYLAVPVMIGASGLKLFRFFSKGNVSTSEEAAILGVGCIVAFLVSLVAIRFLMNFVKKHDFKPFGWYRIILGIVVIAYFALAA